MNSSITYFIYILVAVVVGVFFVKKVTGCLIKSILAFLILAILVVLYYLNA